MTAVTGGGDFLGIGEAAAIGHGRKGNQGRDEYGRARIGGAMGMMAVIASLLRPMSESIAGNDPLVALGAEGGLLVRGCLYEVFHLLPEVIPSSQVFNRIIGVPVGIVARPAIEAVSALVLTQWKGGPVLSNDARPVDGGIASHHVVVSDIPLGLEYPEPVLGPVQTCPMAGRTESLHAQKWAGGGSRPQHVIGCMVGDVAYVARIRAQDMGAVEPVHRGHGRDESRDEGHQDTGDAATNRSG